MKVIRSVTLSGAGLDFTLSNHEDESGEFQAYLTDLAGFYGGVGITDSNEQRKLGHGYFPEPGLRTGRELTVSGTLTFKDERTRLIADRFVSGILWDGEFGNLQVATDDLVLNSTVRLSGEIKHEYLGTTAMTVQIPLTAPDPFLYAPARLHQVFPAGFGEGLVYPLFNKIPNGTAVGGLINTTTTSGTVGTFEGNPAFTFTGRATSKIYSVGVTPGKIYTINTATFADKTGSGYAVRFDCYGSSPSSKYMDLGAGGIITPPAPLIDSPKRATYTYEAKPGDTSIVLSFFANHPNYQVQDAKQTFSISVTESAGRVLDWGKGAPYSGAFGNLGNATAYPVITVRGDFPGGFTIFESGRSIVYPSFVDQSAPVVIDCRAGSVKVGGKDQTYRLRKRDWFDVQPGLSIQPRLIAHSPSNGWMDVQLSDTYT